MIYEYVLTGEHDGTHYKAKFHKKLLFILLSSVSLQICVFVVLFFSFFLFFFFSFFFFFR